MPTVTVPVADRGVLRALADDLRRTRGFHGDLREADGILTLDGCPACFLARGVTGRLTIDTRAATIGCVNEHPLDVRRLAIMRGIALDDAVAPWPTLPTFGSPAPPPFPLDALPDDLRSVAEEVARFVQVPVEAVALVMLGTLSAAVRGTITVRVRGDYTEPVTLFALLAMESGSRKSELFRRLVAPIASWEAEAKRRMAPEREAKRVERKRLETQLRRAQQGDDEDAIRAAAAALAACAVPPEPRIIADDVTAEKLAMLLAEQGGRLAIMAPEGSVFKTLLGLYTRGQPNVEPLLRGWSGEPLRIDRVTRDYVLIERATLTLCVAVQPDSLHQLTGHAELRDRGFLARLLMLVPTPNIGARLDDPDPIAPAVLSWWGDLLTRLLALASRDGIGELTLTADAYATWRRFYVETERGMADGGPYERLRDWGSKAAGQVIRIAALLHVVGALGRDPRPVAIGDDTMRRAVALGGFFRESARRLLTADDALAQRARRVAAWLARRGEDAVTAREVQRAQHYARAAEAQEVVEELVALGVLRRLRDERGLGLRYAVHPDLGGAP